MISITSTWPEYFRNSDEGLGTTYERFILHRYFEKLRKQFLVESVVEVPSFGMTGISGINSMWWAKKGINVTVVDERGDRLECIRKVWQGVSLRAEFVQSDNCGSLPFETGAFDMGWNFASLWFVPDLTAFLEELTRITRKVVFICVPNRLGMGYISRRMLGDRCEGLHYENIRPGRIKAAMRRLGWRVSDEGFLDVPPWPDIAMKKEDLLKKFGLGRVADRICPKGGNGSCILDYYGGRNEEMDKSFLKYAFLEESSWVFKRFWAHHCYAIFAPRRPATSR
jgi:SAM-dependent methyltransferase